MTFERELDEGLEEGAHRRSSRSTARSRSSTTAPTGPASAAAARSARSGSGASVGAALHRRPAPRRPRLGPRRGRRRQPAGARHPRRLVDERPRAGVGRRALARRGRVAVGRPRARSRRGRRSATSSRSTSSRASCASTSRRRRWPARDPPRAELRHRVRLLLVRDRVVIVLTAIAVGWMLVFFARSGARHPVIPAALGLLIGGSVSNLVDRVRLGHVTDFLDFGGGRPSTSPTPSSSSASRSCCHARRRRPAAAARRGARSTSRHGQAAVLPPRRPGCRLDRFIADIRLARGGRARGRSRRPGERPAAAEELPPRGREDIELHEPETAAVRSGSGAAAASPGRTSICSSSTSRPGSSSTPAPAARRHACRCARRGASRAARTPAARNRPSPRPRHVRADGRGADAGGLERLSALVRRRALDRTYLALVQGRPRSRAGRIEAPIGRDRDDPTRSRSRRRRRATRSRTSRSSASWPRPRAAARPARDGPDAPDSRPPGGDRPARRRRRGLRRRRPGARPPVPARFAPRVPASVHGERVDVDARRCRPTYSPPRRSRARRPALRQRRSGRLRPVAPSARARRRSARPGASVALDPAATPRRRRSAASRPRPPSGWPADRTNRRRPSSRRRPTRARSTRQRATNRAGRVAFAGVVACRSRTGSRRDDEDERQAVVVQLRLARARPATTSLNAWLLRRPVSASRRARSESTSVARSTNATTHSIVTRSSASPRRRSTVTASRGRELLDVWRDGALDDVPDDRELRHHLAHGEAERLALARWSRATPATRVPPRPCEGSGSVASRASAPVSRGRSATRSTCSSRPSAGTASLRRPSRTTSRAGRLPPARVPMSVPQMQGLPQSPHSHPHAMPDRPGKASLPLPFACFSTRSHDPAEGRRGGGRLSGGPHRDTAGRPKSKPRRGRSCPLCP